MKKLILIALTAIFATVSFATTWDEPWQEEVLEKSEYLVFGRVVSANDSAVQVEIRKSFGTELRGTIIIDGFFLLNLCSLSEGHGPEFYVQDGDEGYFFLKKGSNGNYELPTPTAGFDRIVEDRVHATFRHSYHQAAILPSVYEMAYNVIWRKYRGLPYDATELTAFMEKYLAMAPAGFEEEEIDIFFNQHVALEAACHLGIRLEYTTLKKFAESDNFHAQVSALRAFVSNDSNDSKEFLLAYITDDRYGNFTKVIAIRTLWNMGDQVYRKELKKLQGKLSDEETGFGGNIMDPRVCTHFPSPQSAISQIREHKEQKAEKN